MSSTSGTIRPDKTTAVQEITEAFRASSAAVLTEYRGLTVSELTELRRALGAGTTYSIVKNTLTKIAAKEAGLEGLDDLLTGPTAIAFVTGDPVDAAKSVRDFARAHPLLVVKGGVLEGRALDAEGIRKLADLESREVLLGRMAGAMLASLSQAVYLLNAPLAQVARLAAALRDKAEADPTVLQGTLSADGATEVPAAVSPDPLSSAEVAGVTERAEDADGEAVTAGPAADAATGDSTDGTDSTSADSAGADSAGADGETSTDSTTA